jgi:pyruvate formate lyase activating enzyme
LNSLTKKANPLYKGPVIQDNDDEKNIRQLCVLLANLDSVTEVNLLPVHHLGKQRYYSLNRDYPIENVPFISQESLDHLQKIIRSYGLKCSVVG